MKATICSVRGLEPTCRFYAVADGRAHEVVAVVEAEHEPEAREFFATVRQLLQAALESNIRVLESEMPPNEVPVFRRKYFQAMQVKTQMRPES